MLIDGREVPGSMLALELAGSGQQGFDHLVAQDPQGGQRTHPVGGRLVAPRVFDLMDQLLGSELLQVVSGEVCTPIGLGDRTSAARAEALNPRGEAARATTASATARIRAWFKSIPPTRV